MPLVEPELLNAFWTELADKLRREHPSAGQLKIGKQGVYLIDRSQQVTSFELVSWQQLTQGPL